MNGPKVNLGTEPTLIINVVAAALALLVTFQWDGLSQENAGAIVAVITAVAAAVNAFAVRPIAPAVFTGVVGAVVALLATYGFNVPAETVAAINGLVITALALIFRAQVTPVAKGDPVRTIEP
jgi:dipeptide/tripeptide permease